MKTRNYALMLFAGVALLVTSCVNEREIGFGRIGKDDIAFKLGGVQTKATTEDFFISTIDSGTPILINWVDWVGHWQVLIGLDTCGTDDVLDDVLIMAAKIQKVPDTYASGTHKMLFLNQI